MSLIIAILFVFILIEGTKDDNDNNMGGGSGETAWFLE